MTMKTLPWITAVPERPARRALRLFAAAVLRASSVALDRLSRRLATLPQRPARAVPTSLEFHAEAGAPEGALYVDGELVGRLPGVTRL
jgi:hypothetical protein